jgi:hypothetical protein
MGTRIPGTRIRPEYPGIYRVFLVPYTTRIRSYSIRVLPVSVPNIKIPESVSEKRVFVLSVSGTRRVYPTRFDPYSPATPSGSSSTRRKWKWRRPCRRRPTTSSSLPQPPTSTCSTTPLATARTASPSAPRSRTPHPTSSTWGELCASILLQFQRAPKVGLDLVPTSKDDNAHV